MCQNALSELESQGLDLGGVVVKRARWEALGVTLVDADAGRVNVRNASKETPSVYTVEVGAEGVPETCTCPYDENRPDPCKHRAHVALNDVLMGALDTAREETDTDAELVTDGGRDRRDCVADRDNCPGPHADTLPCFECWRVQPESDSD